MEITKEYLEQEYLVKGRTSKDIAKELEVNHARVRSAIHRFGLSGQKIEKLPEHVTQEKVYQLYIEEALTKEQTAKQLNITYGQLEHFLRSNNMRNLKGHGNWVIKELKLSEEYLTEEYLVKRRTADDIAKEHNLTDGEIEYMLERYEIYGKKGMIKDFCNEEKFDVKDPIFCYYAGLIATDGYVDLKNGRVCIRMSNEGVEDTLNNLAEYFEFTGDVKNYPKYKNGEKYGIQYDLTITSQKLIEVLAKLNVTGDQKTRTIKFPEEFNSDDCARMFIRGVVDGDGSICGFQNNVGFRVTCDSEDFIVGLIKLINNRFNSYIKLKHVKSTKNNKTYPSCYIGAHNPQEIVDWVYSGYVEYRLKDKYEAYNMYRSLVK